MLTIRDRVLGCEDANIREALCAARQFGGLGTSGASGLLALLFPAKFGTVDQFVVRTLRRVRCLPEQDRLDRMNPESLNDAHGGVLVGIRRRKADSLNQLFNTAGWTPRKIDTVQRVSDRQ